MELCELSDIIGPSGKEGPVRDLLAGEIRNHVQELSVDCMGNLFASKHGSDAGPRVMIAAHMDEVGFIISHIEESGLLRFKKIGGIDDRILPATTVVIGDNRVPGVIGSKPLHLQEPEERKHVPKSDDLYIDIGSDDGAAAKELVKVGDYAGFDTRCESFGDNLIKGKALDDRLGCYLLAGLLQDDYRLPVSGAFTVQEEVGLRGAQVAAFRLQPDVALVLEVTTCADVPGTDPQGESTKLGHGPALSFMDATTIAHKPLLEMLVNVAVTEGITYQWKRTTFGGNDAGSIHKARGGVPTVSISVPGRYIHSPCAVVSRADMANALALARAFLRRLDKERQVPGATGSRRSG